MRAPEPIHGRVPPPLAALLERMLDFDPTVRPTAADVVAQLEPLVDTLPRKLVLSRRGMRLR
ncbi:MAG TPA: hypothetical protein VGR11_04880 [Solirubrobacteraceae bacterium]|nr:hypothetical protein [Solirubrobacteraceae bacterium]